MTDPSPDALRKIAEEALVLAEKATPGPWRTQDTSQRAKLLVRGFEEPASRRITQTHLQVDPVEDVEFIAHARTLLPALASAYLASSARVKELEADVLFYYRLADEVIMIVGDDDTSDRENMEKIAALLRNMPHPRDRDAARAATSESS